MRGKRKEYHFSQITQRHPTIHGIDAHGAFADSCGRGLVERSPHQGAGFGLHVRSDAVFEVVGDAVGGECARLVDEALRGAGDCFISLDLIAYTSRL